MNRQRGFSLIETVIFIVIVGVAVAGMVTVFTTNVAHSPEPLLRQKAVALANFYMDEILRKKWNEASPAGGGCVNTGSGKCPAGPAAIAIGTDGDTRANFDDIDDYNGVNDATPVDQSGIALANFNGYSVTVAVSSGTALDPLTSGSRDIDASDTLMIVVNVMVVATGDTISLTAYRGNF
jgi:MSHA pilin protein MshD